MSERFSKNGSICLKLIFYGWSDSLFLSLKGILHHRSSFFKRRPFQLSNESVACRDASAQCENSGPPSLSIERLLKAWTPLDSFVAGAAVAVKNLPHEGWTRNFEALLGLSAYDQGLKTKNKAWLLVLPFLVLWQLLLVPFKLDIFRSSSWARCLCIERYRERSEKGGTRYY